MLLDGLAERFKMNEEQIYQAYRNALFNSPKKARKTIEEFYLRFKTQLDFAMDNWCKLEYFGSLDVDLQEDSDEQ